LFRNSVIVAIRSGRRWILGSSTAKLLGLYRRIGCQVTDLRYRHEELGGEEHTIFLGDVNRVVRGRGVGPLVWNGMFADLSSHLEGSGAIRIGVLARGRLRVYRLFRPMTRMLVRRRGRARKTKSKA
jgi:hypothetical protein